MFKHLFIACLSLSLLSPLFTSEVRAQSSFGRKETTAPQNLEQWTEQTLQAFRRALRRSDTALNTVGANRNHSTIVAITIARDGSVTDVRVVESSGNPAMDAAFIRHFSAIRDIPAFTPDMNVPSITLPLPIGTRRG
ncbi:TonB family protein [Paracoccus caeni]|nr:TonB family protein [Paracoccus caeni]